MARRKRGGLGSAAGSRAVHSIWMNLKKYQRLFGEVQKYANYGDDPLRAIRAEAEAKKALLDAQTGFKLAAAAGVFVPSDYRTAFETALRSAADLAPLVKTAQERANDMRQVEPEWKERDYVGPEEFVRDHSDDPATPWRGWADGLGGMRRGRRVGCRPCPRRRRRR